MNLEQISCGVVIHHHCHKPDIVRGRGKHRRATCVDSCGVVPRRAVVHQVVGFALEVCPNFCDIFIQYWFDVNRIIQIHCDVNSAPSVNIEHQIRGINANQL